MAQIYICIYIYIYIYKIFKFTSRIFRSKDTQNHKRKFGILISIRMILFVQPSRLWILSSGFAGLFTVSGSDHIFHGYSNRYCSD